MQPSNSPGSISLNDRAPRLVSNTHYCVMGDVIVADDAMIAPGVVLQAAPGSRIAIASGACLAGGVCIQSRQGVLTIGSGANIGANVLVVGRGDVGSNACISPGSTLVNPHIEAAQIVPPNALIQNAVAAASAPASGGFTSGSYAFNGAGYTSNSHANIGSNTHQVAPQQADNSFENTFVEPPPVGPKALEAPDLSDQNGQYVDPSAQNPSSQSNGVQLSWQSNSSALSITTNDRVYGKDQVAQLLSTLFPNRVT